MKKIIIIFALFAVYTNVFGENQKDFSNNQESYEQLKKEFEELKYRPISREHFAWMARCEKNDECKKKTRENFNKISREELTEALIESMKGFDGECTYHEERDKNIREEISNFKQDINENKMAVVSYIRFNRICNAIAAGLLIGEGVLFLGSCAPTIIKVVGGSSIMVGIGFLFRALVE